MMTLGLTIPFAKAQKKHSVSGYVKDAASGEALIAASVGVPSLGIGASTNEYGFFSISLPEGKYELQVFYVGYSTHKQAIDLNGNLKLNVLLKEETFTLEEVIVSAESPKNNIESTEMSVTRLEVQGLKTLPVMMGEVDIVKSIQLLPGVQSSADGMSGFFVRGGSADQNLILLDEATVYNASHLLGFFSVFNADAIKDVNLYKGGMPAQYGGRLSSVMDIRMLEGNNQRFKATGGIGTLSSRLTVEAPIVKDKGSFILSGRRTYLDVFTRMSPDPETRESSVYFYDLNAKANYQLGENDRIYISSYMGRDYFVSAIATLDWGNITNTVRWNHQFGPKLFSNLSFIYSDFNYGIGQTMDEDQFSITAGIRDYSIKADFDHFLNNKVQLKYGIQPTFHSFQSGKVTVTGPSNIADYEQPRRNALENAAYITADHKINYRLSMQYGLRYSHFAILGPGEYYQFGSNKVRPEEITSYEKGQLVKAYHGAEPRLLSRYKLSDASSIKASYAKTRQYIHQASNSASTLPLDLWVASSNIIQPQIADQVAAGYFQNLKDNQYEASVEVYYKHMQNQIDFRDGADIVLNPYVEGMMLFGKGWSYGSEWLIRKNSGKLTGWLGYTLSWTKRQIEGINNGNPYNARNDRRHDFSSVANYQLSPRWSVSASWIYATGLATSFPSAKYELDGQIIAHFSERNADRLPANHRLDVSATLRNKPGKKFQSSWTFSVFNLYNRKNPFAYHFRQSQENPEKTEVTKIYLMPVLPSVTYNFTF
jgi:hypothetical protein